MSLLNFYLRCIKIEAFNTQKFSINHFCTSKDSKPDSSSTRWDHEMMQSCGWFFLLKQNYTALEAGSVHSLILSRLERSYNKRRKNSTGSVQNDSQLTALFASIALKVKDSIFTYRFYNFPHYYNSLGQINS